MSMAKAIEPKSDQMNSEDLLSGERTLTITEVKVFDSPEQPVHIWFAEFPKGRPFKPSKTVSRILVAAWGDDENRYVGRRLTLYRDPDVEFGKSKVGGIRVKAMSHLEGEKAKGFSVMLSKSRQAKASWRIEALADAAPSSPPVDEETVRALADLRAEWKAPDTTAERKAAIEAEVARLQGGGSDV